MKTGALASRPARPARTATKRNIRQNPFWDFAYNMILIPIAMGALSADWSAAGPDPRRRVNPDGFGCIPSIQPPDVVMSLARSTA